MIYLWRNLRSTPKGVLLIVLIVGFVISLLFNLFLIPFGKGLFGTGLPSEIVRYEGKSFPFSIEYPENWTVFETPNGDISDEEVIAWILPKGGYNPQISIQEKEFENPSIEMIIRWRKNKLNESLKEYKEISENKIEISGQIYYVHNFSWQGPDFFSSVNLKCREYAFIKDEKGYSVWICAENELWNQYEGVFQRILDSFSIL